MNLRDGLGATAAAAAQRFSIYLPNRDAEGDPIHDIEDWIDVAIDMLTKINGGATCLPPAYGTWRKSGRQKIVQENTRVVYSYITDAAKFSRNIHTISTFIHSFGRECRQEAVLAEFSGEDKATFVHRAYFIDSFPKAQSLDQVR